MNKLYLGDHTKGEIEIIEEKIVYQNRYITHYNDDVLFPDGSKGSYVRSAWNAPYGVMVAPVKDGRLLLVNNFRHEKRLWTWELVKGFGEEDLTQIECANKELEEETGFFANSMEAIKVFPDCGYYCVLYRANDLIEKSDGDLESGEAIREIKFFTKDEAKELLNSVECIDPMTMFVISQFISGQYDE